jgi:hypothetical protein
MPILGSNSSGGSRPSAPVIGSATDGGTGTTASVAFTPSTYIGKGTITYTATSSPGNFTGTGSSPITVSGLTTGTAYTFTVRGTTNYGVTSASSSASNSVTPAVPSSFDSIATSTPTSGSSVTFSSIPSTYKSLQIRYLNKNSSAGRPTYIQFNSDTGTNYSYHFLQGNGDTANTSFTGTSKSYIQADVTNGFTDTLYPMAGIIDVIDYASTSKNKTVRGFYGIDTNNTVGQGVSVGSGAWYSTSAINSITITTSGTFGSGTSIALYGIK